MSTVKEEVKSLLERLPRDCTIEDIQYHLYVLEKKFKKGFTEQKRKEPFPMKM